jgi:hypothetical protein
VQDNNSSPLHRNGHGDLDFLLERSPRRKPPVTDVCMSLLFASQRPRQEVGSREDNDSRCSGVRCDGIYLSSLVGVHSGRHVCPNRADNVGPQPSSSFGQLCPRREDEHLHSLATGAIRPRTCITENSWRNKELHGRSTPAPSWDGPRRGTTPVHPSK